MEITTFTTTITGHDSKITGAGVVFLGTTFDLSENHLGLHEPAQTQWRRRVTSSLIDSVSHKLLAEKLKSLPINPHIINWWLGFLRDRKQRVIFGSSVCDWNSKQRHNPG